MRIAVVGSGPAGLSAALTMRTMAGAERVTLLEGRRAEGGFGIILSSAALRVLACVDPPAAAAVREAGVSWDAVDILGDGWSERFAGHPYLGIHRSELVEALSNRCTATGVELREARPEAIRAALDEADVVVAADGTGSPLRNSLAGAIGPSWREGANWFAWLGCSKAFDCHTFVFTEHEGGRWCAHAYPYADGSSTLIAECSPETARAAGLAGAGGRYAASLCERIFAAHLDGAAVVATEVTRWHRYRTLTTRRWWSGKIALVGDAAHSAHFSIGSGTRLAMEDSLALAGALARAGDGGVARALAAYEAERRPAVERFQEAAEHSQRFFEDALADLPLEPHEPFVHRLMTRSGRVAWDRIEADAPDFARRLRVQLGEALSVP